MNETSELKISGERVALGHANDRNQQDHVDRYAFAQTYVHGKRVLDVACGTGFGSQMLAQAGATHVDGVDISEESIAYAKRNHSDPRVTYHCRSAEDLPFNDGEFNIVTSFETIEHLEDEIRARYLDELYRVLTDDGVLILSTPNKRITSPWKDKPNNPFHVLEYTKDMLTHELQEHSFSIVTFNGQRFIFKPLTWYLLRKGIRFIEVLLKRNFNIYDVASGRGVYPISFVSHPRYFVWVCKKVN